MECFQVCSFLVEAVGVVFAESGVVYLDYAGYTPGRYAKYVDTGGLLHSSKSCRVRRLSIAA